MRKTVIFTMILTLIFSTVGCTVHSEPGKKAVESSSSNPVFDIAQAEELSEKTINETVDKSTFAEETTQTTAAETGTEKVPNEPIFSQATTANNEPKQDTHTQTEPPKSEKSEPEITTNTVSEVTTADEQSEEFDINYWIFYLSKYEKEEAYLITQIKQLTAAKERLGSQIDRLDCSDRHYEQKYTDMQNRINSLYDEIAEATENLETVQTQIKAIKEQKISQKRIFEFLELFDIIYNEFTEFEKKEFLHSFIKKIEIYPEPLENGQILKSIQFRFPVYYQGNEADMFIPNFENTVETVVLMTRTDAGKG